MPVNIVDNPGAHTEAYTIDIVEKDRIVAFSYRLTDETGAELDRRSQDDPMVYLHGYRNILQGLERALEGKAVGTSVTTTLPPELAYGYRNEPGIQRVPTKYLLTEPKHYRMGTLAQVNTADGPRDVVIVKMGKFNVDVDINHPYAGKTLTYELTVERIREPTPSERLHRHAHGLTGDEEH